MLEELIHPPFRDGRFWVVLAMISLVFAIHLGADFAANRALTPLPSFIWALLLVVPIIYAGTAFGRRGSIGAGIFGVAALIPSELIVAHTATELWSEWSTLVMLLVIAVLIGTSIQEARDAAQARAAAQSLAESEEGFRLAFESNMAGMAVANLAGEVLVANGVLAQMIGYTREELIGVNFMDFTHPDDHAVSAEINARLALGEVEQECYTKRFVRKDGSLVFAEVSRSLARDEAGVPSLAITSVRDITQEKSLAEQLSYQALHDPLTGLPNRVLFSDRLPRAMQRGLRHGGLIALLLLDLDDFKGVNDTLGHHVGDQLLISVARRLSLVTRSSDTWCRFGGDEFIYLTEGLSNLEDALEIAQRVLNALGEPFLIGTAKIVQSASIGVVVSEARSDIVQTRLIQDVDTALYEAKRLGKARMVAFDPEMRERSSSRFRLAQDLAYALSYDEISMHYQPIIDLAEGGIVGLEALMRWNHPDLGWVAPDIFIPLAEESDLIVKLGAFALRAAAREASDWASRTRIKQTSYVSVNLSARQFHDPALISTIEEVLQSEGLMPQRLVIEITESVALSDIESALRVVQRLKQLNVAVALDDFGTGYSSLGYLALLHPAIIKIDKSFVSPIHPSPYTERLLEAMISLCQALDMTVLAEGIETPEQLALLRRLGCELGQGFLFSAAVPPSQLGDIPARFGQAATIREAK